MADYIKSPLNYTGGKYKILNQIIPLFPDKIKKFVDLFGGGFNVGINVCADKIYYNDIVTPLCDLMKFFATNSSQEIVELVDKNIANYQLSKTNKDAFLKLRSKYNNFHYINDIEKNVDFYTLILYSFNYQIRFNRSMQFNTPFGLNRSSFNTSIRSNLISFVNRLNSSNVSISNNNFVDFNYSELSCGDLVYCDPPYLITTGSYNDGNRGIKDWTIIEEKQLTDILDKLNDKGIKFALSNVFCANGQTNDHIISWSKKYFIHHIHNSFNNSNYHRTGKNDVDEVIITNFE